MDRALGLGSSQGEDSPNLQGVAPVVENWGLLSNRVWRFCGYQNHIPGDAGIADMGTDNHYFRYCFLGFRGDFPLFACIAIYFPHYGEGRILSIRQLSEQN